MRYKIVRFQKLMWHNIMRSIKNKKKSVLHYSINNNNVKKDKMIKIHQSEKKLVIKNSAWDLNPYVRV
jgi:hypothetical protein